jgi:hypothetical protein
MKWIIHPVKDWWDNKSNDFQCRTVVIVVLYLAVGFIWGAINVSNRKQSYLCNYNINLKKMLIAYPAGCYVFGRGTEAPVRIVYKEQIVYKDKVCASKEMEAVAPVEIKIRVPAMWPKDINDFCAEAEKHDSEFNYNSISFKTCKHMLSYMKKNL